MLKVLPFFLLLLAACGSSEQPAVKKYFDLKDYIGKEAERLEKAERRVLKQVRRNETTEVKEDFKPDWLTEFGLFSDSDINKPAWKNSYKVIRNGQTTYYHALDSNLRTRSIEFKFDEEDKIAALQIVNRTKNYLYNSSELLIYIPDSIYRIVKKQDVVLLGKNQYEISGIFK